MFKYISQDGSVLSLDGNENFVVSNIDGLTEASNDLATSTVFQMDGDIVNNVRTMPRSIVVDLYITGNVEQTKRLLLQYIKPKQTGTLQWVQDGREIEIQGIVEIVTLPRFTNEPVFQFTLYCSQPYWEDQNQISNDISELINLFYFTTYAGDMFYISEEGMAFGEYDQNRTTEFKNEGDVSVGLTITIVATGTVTNPMIFNSKYEYIGINDTLLAGDQVVITTLKGKKTITKNGNNILSKIKKGSTWLQMPVGLEELTIDADTGDSNMYFTVTYKQRYV